MKVYTEDAVKEAISSAYNAGREYQADRDMTEMSARFEKLQGETPCEEMSPREAYYSGLREMYFDLKFCEDAFTHSGPDPEHRISDVPEMDSCDNWHECFVSIFDEINKVSKESPNFQKKEAIMEIVKILAEDLY